MKLEKIQRLLEQKRFSEAKIHLEELSQKDDKNTSVLYLLSITEAELGNAANAVTILSRLLSLDPKFAKGHYAKGLLLSRMKMHSDAMPHHNCAVTLIPQNPWVFINRGVSRAALGDFEGAIDDFNQSITINSTLSVAFQNKANALQEIDSLEEAIACYDKALSLDSRNPEIFSNKAACLAKLKRSEDAVKCADQAIELRPDYAEAWNNRGNALNDLKQHENALMSYQKAINIKADYAVAWNNFGKALNDFKQHEKALSSCEQALVLNPNYAEAWSNRGIALNDLGRYREAIVSLEKGIKLASSADFLLGYVAHIKMKVCDWTGLDDLLNLIRDGISRGEKVSSPFPLLGLFDSAEIQKKGADIYVKQGRLGGGNHKAGSARSAKKIRVGYFSMDFRQHPVSYLISELIELHDRDRFEIYGFSFGINYQDDIRLRLERAFDVFFDINNLSEIDISRLSRQHKIDIGVDLGGHTQDSRPQIFSHRAAPIQINYLGYPGTWGGDCIDYFIGDRYAVTNQNRQHFSEKIIYMPGSFQVNPSYRPTSSQKLSRELFNLPEAKFVFCCFNNTWKITPEIFSNWMEIMQESKDSVLWLHADNLVCVENLQCTAERNGICATRIIFAQRAPRDIYQARFKLADLFLDTSPYNAGTTASDALWSGLPVLTQAGNSFVGRMASSLLENIGLPELIAHSSKEYKQIAVELATNRDNLLAIKQRLISNKSVTSLFNPGSFARSLESAYQKIFDRYCAGLSPEDVYVQS